MYSLSTPYSSGKQRISPPSSPDGPRPAYSILCNETRTLMLGCLRKISSVIQKNERRIEERNRFAEQEKQSSQAAQIVSTNLRDLLTRFLLKIKPSQSTTKTIQLKPLLSPEIIELLINTKTKYSEMFQVNKLIKKSKLISRHFLLDRSKYI
jgi:hypothetical protein